MSSFPRYIKESFLSLGANKTRVILLLVGTTISIIIACFANMYLSSYNYCQSIVYEDYLDNNLRLNYRTTYDTYEKLKELDAVNEVAGYKTLGISDGLHFYSATYNFLNIGLPSEVNSDSIVKPKFIMGRNFNLNDILLKSEVAIINTSIANSLNVSVGDYVFWESSKYQVVGIINDTPDILARKYNISSQNDPPQRTPSFNIYVLDHSEKSPFDILVFTLNEAASDKVINQVRLTIAAENSSYFQFAINSRQNLINKINITNQKQNNLIESITYIAIILAIIFSLIVILFMIKDKIYEIGIKRAIGASMYDILAQTLLEIVMLLSLCMIIGSYFSVLFLSIVLPELYYSVGITISNLDVLSFISPQLLIATVVTVLSLIPLSFACFSKIVNILKFD